MRFISLKPIFPIIVTGFLILSCGGGGGGGSTQNYSIPNITIEPADVTVPSRSITSFSVTTKGDPSPTYAWQRSNDGGSTWEDISGANSASYSITPQYCTDNGAKFRAIITNFMGTATSSSATLSVTPINVYASGIYQRGETSAPSGYWKNGTWIQMSKPSSYDNISFTSALAINGSDVYLCAYSTNPPSPYAGYWLNGTWSDLPIPPGSTGTSNISGIAVSKNNVYIATSFMFNEYTPGYLLNGAWTAVSPGTALGSLVGAVTGPIAISGSDIYIAGTTVGSLGNQCGYWKNGTWIGLSAPTGYSNVAITSLTIVGNDVYASGFGIPMNGSHDVPFYWKNGICTVLNLPLNYSQGNTTSISVCGQNVCVGGYCEGALNLSLPQQLPGYWLNGAWISLQAPSGSIRGMVNCVLIYGHDVWAGGTLSPTSGNPSTGYWLNGIWVELTVTTGSYWPVISSLIVE